MKLETELKPGDIEKSWAEGWYKPYCLFDGDNIVGEAFLWLGLGIGLSCIRLYGDRISAYASERYRYRRLA